MDYSLMLIYTQGKMFVGKECIKSPGADEEYITYLEECVECLPMMTPDGNYMIIGNVLGMLEVPMDCVKVTLSKDSIYYRNYYQVTSKVEVVSVKPASGPWPKRVN